MRFGLNYLFLCCVFFASPLAAQEVKACLNKSHCTAVKKSTLPKHAVVKTTKKETKKKEVKKSAAKKNVATKKLDESKKIEEPKQLTEPKKNEVEASSQEVPAKKDFSKTHSAISQKLWRGITTSDLELLKKATVAIENKNYDEALKLAQELKTTHGEESKKISLADALIDVVLWNKFSGKIDPKKVSFSDISRFALDNPFYPNLNEIRRNVERVAMANNISYQASEQYFNTNLPVSFCVIYYPFKNLGGVCSIASNSE